MAEGRDHPGEWRNQSELITILLGEDPKAIADALLDALHAGCTSVELAETVAYAAALHIARFHTSNEFGDWDTALHTLSFANAIHQGLLRTPSPQGADLYPPLLRGVFDAAMSVYLDRFLNVPAARLPGPDGRGQKPGAALEDLTSLLDRQQQVDAAADLVAGFLYAGGDAGRLLATLGRLLLREDRDFHTIQTLEAAFTQFILISRHARNSSETPSAIIPPAGVHVIVAAVRYLAAHAPTMRAQGQTYQIANRLSRGERLFEE